MKKLAVIFPGIGYTADKPLLHYSRKLAKKYGYEIQLITYQEFPKKVMGDRKKMVESYRIALAGARKKISGIDVTEYEDVIFISKSVGTIVAVQLASESGAPVRHILFTPLDDTFRFPVKNALTFTGTADPWVGKENSRIGQLCEERGIPCVLVPGADHSLETDDVKRDVLALADIMEQTERFILQDS